MPDGPRNIARTGIEAYNRGDVDAMFELATDDVEFVVPYSMANPGTYAGRAGFEAMMGQWEEAWEEFRIEILDMIEEGDAVIVSIAQFGRGRGSGIETQMNAAHVMWFRDGRLCRWLLCPSLDEAFQQVRHL
jgi:ketosteroid isomerase-like protein